DVSAVEFPARMVYQTGGNGRTGSAPVAGSDKPASVAAVSRPEVPPIVQSNSVPQTTDDRRQTTDRGPLNTDNRPLTTKQAAAPAVVRGPSSDDAQPSSVDPVADKVLRIVAEQTGYP